LVHVQGIKPGTIHANGTKGFQAWARSEGSTSVPANLLLRGVTVGPSHSERLWQQCQDLHDEDCSYRGRCGPCFLSVSGCIVKVMEKARW
jgi:hypothetical protein